MPAPPQSAVAIETLGDTAVVVRIGGAPDDGTLRRIAAARERIERAAPAGVVDVAATFTTVAVWFDPEKTDAARVAAALAGCLAGGVDTPLAAPRCFDIPVTYGGADGPDLAAVATATGLDPADVVARHVAAAHVVGMIGFAPGFPYLLGLPDALRIPRRAAPRTAVEAGAVAIAEGQTGIYPRRGPGGWHVIGRTAVDLFDPARHPPALLRAGDRVRFVPVAAAPPAAAAGPRQADAGQVVVVAAGAATSVQDAGRAGWRHAGVGPGGAADATALAVANLLVGNPEGAAAIEATLVGPRLRLERGTWVALCGAPLEARVVAADGGATPLPRDRPVWVPAGAEVAIGTLAVPAGRAPRGVRAVLALGGGIDVPRVLGSRSTDARGGFGGLAGRPLATGDRLPLGTGGRAPPAAAERVGIAAQGAASSLVVPAPGAGPVTLAVLPGPEASRFPAAAVDALGSATFTVGADSDRTGLRLDGPPLAGPRGILSEALVPGTIQVPSGGRPIVVGVDAPVTGGYARIAVVARADLPRLAQLAPGEPVRFAWVDAAGAAALVRRRRDDLARFRIAWEALRWG